MIKEARKLCAERLTPSSRLPYGDVLEWRDLLDEDESRALRTAQRKADQMRSARFDLASQALMALLTIGTCMAPLEILGKEPAKGDSLYQVTALLSCLTSVFVGYALYAIYGLFRRVQDTNLMWLGLTVLTDPELIARASNGFRYRSTRPLRMVDYWASL